MDPQMQQASLAVLACPRCFGHLSLPAAPPGSWPVAELACADEKLRFPVMDGIPQLVSPERANAVRTMAEVYSRVWQKDGWGNPSPLYLLNLPDRDTTGRQSAKWRGQGGEKEARFRCFCGVSTRRGLGHRCGRARVS